MREQHSQHLTLKKFTPSCSACQASVYRHSKDNLLTNTNIFCDRRCFIFSRRKMYVRVSPFYRVLRTCVCLLEVSQLSPVFSMQKPDHLRGHSCPISRVQTSSGKAASSPRHRHAQAQPQQNPLMQMAARLDALCINSRKKANIAKQLMRSFKSKHC